MALQPAWPQVNLRVAVPGKWLILLAGTVFSLAGVGAMLLVEKRVPAGMWFPWVIGGVFVLIGVITLSVAVRRLMFPVYVNCAAPSVLPDVPREPLVADGSVVTGRLTHELCPTEQGWQWQVAPAVSRFNHIFPLAFGLPFLIGFSALVTWVLHNQLQALGWIGSALLAVLATSVCGGLPLLLTRLSLRSTEHRQSHLLIP